MNTPRVGVAGLGAMGLRIARRLLVGGISTTGYDPYSQTDAVPQVDDFEVFMRRSDVLILVLPTVEVTVAMADRIREHPRMPDVVVNHSTVDPQTARDLVRDLPCLDAPVAGGTEAAEQGRLTVFVGGAGKWLETAQPVLDCYASQVIPCGNAGSGSTVKLLHQLFVASEVLATSEMFQLARASGLEPADLVAMLQGTAADTAIVRLLADRLRMGSAVVRGSARVLAKDVRLVLEMAQGVEQRMVLAPLIDEIMQRQISALDHDVDIVALARDTLRQQ